MMSQTGWCCLGIVGIEDSVMYCETIMSNISERGDALDLEKEVPK